MAMTAATFDCPHCGAKYPVKPVLIGKTVRCTSCKNAFRLRGDGIADKVEMTAAAPASAPVSVAQAAEPPKAAPRPDPKTESPPTSRLNVPTPKAGMTVQQVAAQKAMSDNLKAAMGDALGLDEPEPETPEKSAKPGTERVANERKSKSSSFQKTAGKKPGKSPAILTNEGEREAANSRRWLMGFIGVIVVFGLIFWAANHQNERVAAVAAFTTELPASATRYGARIEAIRARAWLNDITAFIDLPSPRISSEREIPSASLEPLAKLTGLTYVASASRWVAPETAAWLAKQPAIPSDKLNAKFERDGTIQVTLAALRKELSAANLGDDEMTIVLAMLTQPSTGSAVKFGELLTSGHLPTIRWCTVSGRGGTYIFDRGQGYGYPVADYRGVLVSFAGEGWPTGWRFMTLAIAK